MVSANQTFANVLQPFLDRILDEANKPSPKRALVDNGHGLLFSPEADSKENSSADLGIRAYVEKHFRRVLDFAVLEHMFSVSPRTQIPAVAIPEVNHVIVNRLGKEAARRIDACNFKLMTLCCLPLSLY